MCTAIETNHLTYIDGRALSRRLRPRVGCGVSKLKRADGQLATVTMVMVAVIVPVEIPAGSVIVPATVVVTSTIRSVIVTTSVESTAVMVMGLG